MTTTGLVSDDDVYRIRRRVLYRCRRLLFGDDESKAGVVRFRLHNDGYHVSVYESRIGRRRG